MTLTTVPNEAQITPALEASTSGVRTHERDDDSTEVSDPPGGGWAGDVEGQRLFALVRSRMFSRGGPLRVGRYRLVRRLGAGAMGEVHLAIDEALDRPVALKFVHAHLASARFAERLRVEARALARLAHPNVVHVYEVGEHEGRVFLAMEHIEGHSLRDRPGDQRSGWEQVLAAYLQAGRGLAAAHSAGVIHRDFKPENVLRGEDGRVAVVDFGLAALEQQSTIDSEDLEQTLDTDPQEPSTLSRSGEVKGTPAYMPPEQFRGQSDARADQFALCVSLYEGLWGRRPFAQRPLAQLLDGEVDWRPLSPPSRGPVPSWIWPIIRRGLAVDPDDRWPSVDELLAALERRLSARRRRTWLLGSGVVALAVGLLSGIGVAWWGGDPSVQDCVSVDRELVGTWDQARRAQLGQVLTNAAAAPGGAWLIDSEAPIVAALERWRERWLASRSELCHARAGGDALVLDRQGACLERQRRSTQAVVELMLAGDLDTLREASGAVLGLGDPRICAREARQGSPPEPGESLAVGVEQARRELSIIEAELLLAHHVAALAKAEQLAVRVDELDYTPLRAELAHLRGRALLGQGRAAEGLEALEAAADLAEGVHHDRVVADSWRQMAMYVATERGELEAGRRWLRRADAAATRVGVEALGAARLDYVRGSLHLLDNQFDQAIEQLEPALATFEAEHQDLLFAAHAATGLGMAVHAKGDRQRALELFGRSLALLERVHGPRHPDVALAAYNLGQTSLEAGDAESSRVMLERAVEIWTHADELELHAAGRAQLVLGQLALAEGRSEDALDHARAATSAFERSSPDELASDQAEAASLLAAAHYFLAQPEPAILAYRRAIQGYADAYGPDDLYLAYFRVGLGWALLAAGRVEDAGVEFESAFAVIEAKNGAAEQDVDVRFGLLSVDIVLARYKAAQARLAQLEVRELAGMELIELELVRGLLALRGDPADPGAGALALDRARAHAKTVTLGEATLEILLDSLGATARERSLAGGPSRGSEP